MKTEIDWKGIGNGTGIEVGKDDTLYWRFGYFVTALVAVLVIVGAVALSVSMIFTKKGE